ncbi:hypothetical protein GPEL0_01f2576 [Geoanaerobacter pelophilus]|uniref:Uncharacterized protein n=1 Tax=Geoanaerobacter pelophilus TaxID=60036 RepID=A0ABQ0MIS2_9BACT|nr:hypothetical protein GPEL0_01f2576 [Geoanaerobacter pelophilus]
MPIALKVVYKGQLCTTVRPIYCFISPVGACRLSAFRLPAAPLQCGFRYTRDYGMLAGLFWFTNFVYSIQNVFHCQGKIGAGYGASAISGEGCAGSSSRGYNHSNCGGAKRF